MKKLSTLIAPGLVLFTAVFSGGWFLQKGLTQEKNVYFQVRLFEEVVDHVLSSYVDPVDRDDLYNSAIQGVLQELGDPNTSFMPASTANDFFIRMEGEYAGVGLEVIPRDGWITVVTPLPGSPGTRAGIRAGDQIVGVGGESTEGWDPDRVVEALRGQPGTDVSMEIRRPGVDGPIPFTVTREVIRLRSVPFALELQDGVGYVPLQSVSETSFREVKGAVDSLRAEGIHDLILDLRGNPGGTLDQGISISDFFLNPGQVVVETRGRAPRQTETYRADQPQAYPDLRVVVLVDERSASAAEIIAGALQDHDRAVVVGAPTYGKGSVQTLFNLTGGNVLRLTTARWYTPLGRSINKEHEDQMTALERSVLTLNASLASLPDTIAKPVYTTEGGRTVLGGGGIIPDVLVMADTLTSGERNAISELDRSGGSFVTAEFNYAVQYVHDHPDLRPGFSLDAQGLEAFRESLAASDVTLSPAAFQKAVRFIRFQLGREIALRAWGDAGEFRRTLPEDRMVQRALELLRRSSTSEELLSLARDRGFSDWTPVAEPQGATEPDSVSPPGPNDQGDPS